MPTFLLQVITPERVEYEGETTSVTVPAETGYLGILANHAPLLATLGPGRLTAQLTRGRPLRIDISGGGFLEVMNNRVVVLARDAKSILPEAPRTTRDL